MRVLVVFASKHGSTEGVARAIAARLKHAGLEIEVGSVGEIGGLEEAGAVVLGSALYFGSWMKEAVEFAKRNAGALGRCPVWLFSSGKLGTEAKDEEAMSQRQLAELTELLHPRDHRVFFGALDRSKLGFGERMAVKAAKVPDGDFRDWDAIDAWADDIASALADP
jgi:menaquinone-dependent protoporphyrinogen oxidase